MVGENEGSPPRENVTSNYQIPKKEQLFGGTQEGTTEKKGIYQDIFNVNNPRPFGYKPE